MCFVGQTIEAAAIAGLVQLMAQLKYTPCIQSSTETSTQLTHEVGTGCTVQPALEMPHGLLSHFHII